MIELTPDIAIIEHARPPGFPYLVYGLRCTTCYQGSIHYVGYTADVRARFVCHTHVHRHPGAEPHVHALGFYQDELSARLAEDERADELCDRHQMMRCRRCDRVNGQGYYCMRCMLDCDWDWRQGQPGPRWLPPPGEKEGPVISDDDVRLLRRLASAPARAKDLAHLFHISPSYARKIMKGQARSSVP